MAEYKELLERKKKDLLDASQQHGREIAALQSKLAAKADDSFAKFKQFALVSILGFLN